LHLVEPRIFRLVKEDAAVCGRTTRRRGDKDPAVLDLDPAADELGLDGVRKHFLDDPILEDLDGNLRFDEVEGRLGELYCGSVAAV
jgi:hypothetical protein